MTTFKHYILGESAYDGNIGFIEMAHFYQKASKSEIKKMEEVIKNEDWEGYKELIYKKLNINLK